MYQHHLHQYHQSSSSWPANVYEVHSTFFTSNPLLYFSHYSEIIVRTSAASASSGYETTPARVKSMSPGQQPLTHHQREIVELLDPQPVLGYLVQNGALHQRDLDAIQSEESQVKANLTLLSKLQENGRRAQNLLVNALRQTGQLHLANLLDEGIRIKTFSGSGYLSKKRHRGQLSLHIEMKALKFDQDAVYSMIKSPHNKKAATMSREWVSADDLRQRISQIMDSQTKLSSLQQFQFVEACDDDDSTPKKTSCLCACFASLFSKKKKEKAAAVANAASKSSSAYISGSDTNGNAGHHHHLPVHPSPSLNERGVSPSRYISHTTTRITSSDSTAKPPSNSMQDLAQSRTSLENLRNLLDLFRQKTEDVHEVLQDSASKTRNGLIKYFEQDRGILVLDTEENDGFVVRIICTKPQHAESIQKDVTSGKVTRELEKCIVSEEVLHRTGLLGIKIKAFIDQDEMDIVEQELV